MVSAFLLLCLAAESKTAPVAEVWPYQARRAPDGVIEYSYDLSPVKKAGGTPDAKAAWGEKKVAEFFRALPKETKVRLKPGTGVTLGIGRGVEALALVSSLAAISEARVVSNDPLARDPGSHLRPALHPEEPKLLLSAEAVLWRSRRLVEGAEAAILLDSDKVHAALWGKIAEKALARIRTSNGDAKEGAAALAARLFAAQTCLDPMRVPPSARADGEVSNAVDAEMATTRAEVDTLVAPGIFGWSKELACARVRLRILARPFPQSRAGAAAALTLLGLLQADPKLAESLAILRSRRDAVEGTPTREALNEWRERTAGKVDDALENMGAFIDALGTLPPVPPPFESSSTPISKFLAELEGAARVSAFDELLAAAQDDRLKFPKGDDAPVLSRMESAIAHLVSDEPNGPQLDSAWRERRAAGFAALVGADLTRSFEGSDPAESQEDRSDLKIRLFVPPTLEVEPAPASYANAAGALARLEAVVTRLNLSTLPPVQPEGGRSAEGIAAEAKRLASTLRGLLLVSSGEAVAVTDKDKQKDLAEARKFLFGWRTDPVFIKDAREARALEINQGVNRFHSAVIGVMRRELLVGFAATPSAELPTPGPFAIAPAEQRYLVPVLVTRGAPAKATAAPLDRATLKALCETNKRQPNEIEAAFIDAMGSR